MSDRVGDKSILDTYDHVAVVVRLKPPVDQDEDINEVFRCTGNSITIRDPLSRGRAEHNYYFNNIFLPSHGQQYVFEGVAKPLIDKLLEGFNSCCFAYGQTGSGKTHSIFGEGNADQRGVLSRSLEYLFERIERRASHKEVGMVVSFTEIYLDQVRDLGRFHTAKKNGTLEDLMKPPTDHLGRSSSKGPSDAYLSQDLAIHESPQGSVYVEDLTLIPVSDIREVLEVVNLGVRMRATYETRLNARSSRSHTIFTVSIVQKSKQSEDIVGSVINFVDLAGSERLAKSQSEGRRFQEAVVINSSLSALGKVVLALASNPQASRHVPYRDSKLTRILQNSLGGNSFTTLLTTIDPSAVNYEESLNSLSFADRCKNVQNKPVHGHIEAEQESHDRVIHRLTQEISQLKQQLETLVSNLAALKEPPVPKEMPLLSEEVAKRSSVTLGQAAPAAPTTSQATPKDSGRGSATASSGTKDEAGGAKDDEEQAAELQRIQEQAELRLEVERDLTKQAERKADYAMARLEQARKDQAERELKRRHNDAELKRRNKELEIEIFKGKSSIVDVSESIAVEQEKECTLLEDNTSDIIRSREEMLRQVPMAFTDEVDAAAMEANIDSQEAGRATEIGQQRLHAMMAVEQSHLRDMKAVERQNLQWLQEKEAAAEHIAAELDGCRSRHQRWHRQTRGELMDAYGLVSQLSKVVDGMEAGVPSQVRSDIRPPSLQLGGLRTRLKKEGALPDRVFEQFSRDGLRELFRQVARYDQMLQQAGHEKASIVGTAAPSPPVAVPVDTDWDSEAFARDFCDIRESVSTVGSAGAPAALQRLDSARLKALCLSLRRRVRMSHDEQEAERALLRDEVTKHLAAHDKVDHIRQLEKDIADYKVKLCFEEGRARQLEVAVQIHSQTASRPSSRGNSRPSSRPASAGPGGGAPRLSRPGSAGPGTRPGSAGPGRIARPMSAGPGRQLSY